MARNLFLTLYIPFEALVKAAQGVGEEAEDVEEEWELVPPLAHDTYPHIVTCWRHPLPGWPCRGCTFCTRSGQPRSGSSPVHTARTAPPQYCSACLRRMELKARNLHQLIHVFTGFFGVFLQSYYKEGVPFLYNAGVNSYLSD